MTHRLSSIGIFILFILTLSLFPTKYALSKKTESLQGEYVAVLFDEPLRSTAEKIITIYPAVKGDLEAIIGWYLQFVVI